MRDERSGLSADSSKYRCPGIPREEAMVGLVPTTPTISSLLAAWQTQLAIKAIHGMTVPWGQAIVFNGLSTKPTKRIYLHDPTALATNRGKWT